jgi:AcrR family transcriptional regulator
MKASERRAAILASAAPIFNSHGFSGTSISEILAATSLEKGGLYNHFASKEELALAAFDYAWDEVNAYFAGRLHGTRSGAAYLRAYADAFEAYVERPVVAGGCPLANATLEADDALPFLRERVRAAFAQLQSFVRHHVEVAVRNGEYDPAVRPDEVADFLIAALEGALVVSRGLRSRESLSRAMATLRRWLGSLEAVA